MVPQLSTGISEKLNHLLEEAIAYDAADMGIIQLFDREDETLCVIAQKGLNNDFIVRLNRVKPFDPTPCGRAIGMGKQVIIYDVEEDIALERALSGVAKAIGFRSVKSVPLLTGEEKVGVLSTYFRKPQNRLQKNQEIPNEHLDKVSRLLKCVAAYFKESELISLLACRDKRGMEVLYDKFAHILYSKILYVIPEESEAQEVLKHTFSAIHENFSTFDQKADKLYPWMVNIALKHAAERNSAFQRSDFRDNSATEENKMIDLLCFGNYSKQDLAEELSIPHDTINTQLREEINKLRKNRRSDTLL